MNKNQNTKRVSDFFLKENSFEQWEKHRVAIEITRNTDNYVLEI